MKQLGRHFIFALCLSTTFAVVAAQTAGSPVADAARRGDQEAARTLLKQGADVNAAQSDGMTALHWAAERGDAAMAEMLLYAGANTAAVTRIGEYTPLHIASRVGSAPVVRALLKSGASAASRATTTGVTPLHLAAASGSVDTVTALLDQKADVNAKESEWEQTPLTFAASLDRVEVVKLLIARGADVNAKSKALDLGKQQTQDRAAAALQRSILAASVPKGQDPTPSQQQAAVQAARELYLTGKAPEPPAPAGAAGAAGGGRRGAPAPAANAQPAAAAPAPGAPAAQGTGQNPDPLNEDGPAPAIASKGGFSALHHAARQGYLHTVQALVDSGANLNQLTGDGHSPLLVALINGQFDVAMLLIKKGANPNLVAEATGVAPLWAAINTQWQPRTRFPQPQEMDLQKATYLDVMQALLDAGADPNARIKVHPWYMVYTGCGNGNCGLSNTAGSTAFWRAAYGTDVDAMKMLIKYGADPNIATIAQAPRGGGGGGRGGRGGAPGAGGPGGAAGGRGGGPDANEGNPAQGPREDPSGVPVVPPGGPGIYPLHAAAGVEYGEGFAGNAHRHAPEGWLPSVKYLVEVLGADVNARDSDGYTPLHHAAARGDNEMILYLVSKGADVKVISRRGQTTADMANGPVSRISPFPETIALLEKLGSKNNHKCQSC